MLSKSIGTHIKQLRIEKRLSQEALAASIFVTRQTISNYETGRSHPDLQIISEALDVDILHLLYGKTAPKEKQASKKKTIIFASISAALLIITLLLSVYTSILKQTRLIVIPNLMVRLFLIPLALSALGATLIQAIDYFFIIGKQKSKLLLTGRFAMVTFISMNLIFVLPYVILCGYVFIQVISGRGTISMIIPGIPFLKQISYFFLTLMYRFPYLYIFIGMALWLFYPEKRIE